MITLKDNESYNRTNMITLKDNESYNRTNMTILKDNESILKDIKCFFFKTR
jgi:hypothetical protein